MSSAPGLPSIRRRRMGRRAAMFSYRDRDVSSVILAPNHPRRVVQALTAVFFLSSVTGSE
jgi:hypothetical protein